jgi:hypothetical protein
MVTVLQLKAERRRAFRQVRKDLNVVQKLLNQLHRQLNRRLEGHYTELLDTQDATIVVEYADRFYSQCHQFAKQVTDNLGAFFV